MWWKILLVIVIAIVLVIVVVVVLGMLVPVGHTASRRVRYARPAVEVWAVVADFEHHAAWRPGITAVRRLDDRDGQPVWEEVRGRRDVLRMQVIAFEPPRRMVTKVVDNRMFGGTWTWLVEPEGERGCTLTITEEGEIFNPVFRFMAHYVLGYRGTMDGLHRALAAKLGETIEFTDE